MNFPDLNILPDDDKPASVRRWRIRQASVACSSLALMLFVVLPALVSIPYPLPILGQVAYAKDQQTLQTELTDIKAALLAQSILAAYKENCAAAHGSQYWTEHVRKMKEDYKKLTGQTFELPPRC